MPTSCAIWLTGLPASGKTTIAQALAQRLQEQNIPVETLDGDEIRLGLSADLGFTAEDRQQHNRRIIFVSKLLIRNGITVLIPLISPYRETRDYARRELEHFVEVYVKCPVEECIRRDPKGLYAKAQLTLEDARAKIDMNLSVVDAMSGMSLELESNPVRESQSTDELLDDIRTA